MCRPSVDEPLALPEPDAVAGELAGHLAADPGAAADFVAGLRAYLRRDPGKLRWLLQPMADVASAAAADGAEAPAPPPRGAGEASRWLPHGLALCLFRGGVTAALSHCSWWPDKG